MRRPGTTAGESWVMTAEKLSLLVELLPTAQSFRDICAILGTRLEVVRREAAPFLAVMKLNGTHPQCGCGRDRFHPYGCVDSRAKSWPSDCLPGHTREQTVELLKRREIAIEMLVAGERQIDVDRALGMSRGGAKNYLRFLSAAQLAEREERIRGRAGRAHGPTRALLIGERRRQSSASAPGHAAQHDRIAA